ncbi:flagellar radial spoke component [Angomonas deanei]|nr:flagellar radial spoke component [Angomonas deanei]|eukprot:EPY26402.1 flagellar radial spoke component [Angomonas deanei]
MCMCLTSMVYTFILFYFLFFFRKIESLPYFCLSNGRETLFMFVSLFPLAPFLSFSERNKERKKEKIQKETMPQISDERIEELFQSAKAYLMSATRDGVSVYDQLAKLMENILDGNMDQLLDHPEALTEYLSALEQHSFAQGDSTSVANEVSSVPPQELRRLAENQTLFERPPPEVRTVIEQPDPYTTVTTTTSKPMEAPKFTTTTAQNEFWTAAGCGLAESEAFLLDRSITRLVMEKNLSEIRFVGKIFGTSGNYYVISSRRYVKDGEKVYKEVNTMPKAPRKKGTVPVQPEPGYVGCNRLSFWVTSHPSSQWVLLPDVTPQQICAARHIRRLFSGDLEAEVVSSPPFPLVRRGLPPCAAIPHCQLHLRRPPGSPGGGRGARRGRGRRGGGGGCPPQAEGSQVQPPHRPFRRVWGGAGRRSHLSQPPPVGPRRAVHLQEWPPDEGAGEGRGGGRGARGGGGARATRR